VGKSALRLPTTMNPDGGKNKHLRLVTMVGKKTLCPPYENYEGLMDVWTGQTVK
jgi:hypothetical protein